MEDNLATWMFGLRMAERLILTLVVLGTAIVLMAVFRRSVERIKFQSEEKVNLSADIVMATPVFALIVIVAYAYVSYRHPVSVDVQTAPSAASIESASAEDPGTAVAEAGGNGTERVTLHGLVPETARPSDIEMARGQALGHIKALNCLVDAASETDPRMQDAVTAAKFSLLTDPVVWDRDTWGSPGDLRLWVMGVADAPSDDLVDIYQARHAPCVQQ